LIRYRIIIAVATAAGRASLQVGLDMPPVSGITLRRRTKAVVPGQLILLAEDNPTNQDVISRQLRMLGYACEIVNNGVEALHAWHKGKHVLLLTDCHMPEMDGYELTRAIRREEAATGTRLPIVAVTASALRGEAERCFAAGMDDYLTKPINMLLLQAALDKWMAPVTLRPARKKKTAPPPAENDDAPGVIDKSTIRSMFGSGEGIFKEILESFLEPSQTIIQEIAAAWDVRSFSSLEDAAHKLKSAARSVGANALADTCADLESAGHAENGTDIERLVSLSRRQMADAIQYITRL
jgi:CheY-like chemotaxis protein/HPt (histidine-containing phosphotransfer) domain-containing protein